MSPQELAQYEIDLAVGIYQCDQDFRDAESGARWGEEQRILDTFEQ